MAPSTRRPRPGAARAGGSGGPVLNIEGKVVAVNAAILPEFGGSNLGVPVSKVRELLADLGLDPSQPGK